MTLSHGIKKIRVLVVDDSAFMRNVIRNLLNEDPLIEVIGVAVDGEDAIKKAAELDPDVITLDVEMPKMNGLQFLKKQMSIKPIRVLMVSSLTQEGATTTIEALSYGAIDFVAKPSGALSLDMHKVALELREKVKEVSKARVRPALGRASAYGGGRSVVLEKDLTLRAEEKAKFFTDETAKLAEKLVVIGSSTGGPGALMEVIPKLPRDLDAGVVIVQHMPPGFTKSLAGRLNRVSQLYVKEAADRDRLYANQVLIAPGGFHLVLRKNRIVSLNTDAPVHGVRPAVDVFVESAVKVFGSKIVGVILTGMGFDGARGMRFVKRSGGKTIAQNEETSVIYGMPRAVVDMGLADEVAPLNKISTLIEELLK